MNYSDGCAWKVICFGWSSTCHMEGTIFTIAPDFNGTCAGAPRMPMLPPGGPGVVPAATCSMYKARWRSNAKLLDAHVSARSVGSRWKACGCSWAAELATTSSSYAITGFLHFCLEYVCGADLVVERSEEECESMDEGVGVISEVLEIDELREESKKPSVESPPTLELKVLPSHLEYAFLGENSTLPVVISSRLSEEEKKRLLGVLRMYKGAIAWRLSAIQGISHAYCTHRILMEDEPDLSHLGFIMGEPSQVVPKKGGMTVITNEKNELIPSRTVTGWRVCIDYRKLNDATRKDHFPLPFIDQMLERLAGQQFYCFLDGFSGYFQIPIAPEDQEKTTFTCPYGTYAYRRMPFGLCNAPATFQRCMVAIFQDMIESSMEVFMDDFSVYGDSFDVCLENLEKMLKRCVETKLMLNWEKCHFMVTEGIVLGHKISRAGIEVDKAKIETISKLPPPSSVKAIRSFLGHAVGILVMVITVLVISLVDNEKWLE
ncbi:hypothetical protein E3N88_21440 [Mikania micrantha]|uniref:Reverse transcriptase domain-containing protein n=1 Tax=Mikania micrantha TaxID=192012 RepID=A0A5N6NMN6_9ASTR|nr:hypothetical protein E3N88_21440 [Mikania micrantha]